MSDDSCKKSLCLSIIITVTSIRKMMTLLYSLYLMVLSLSLSAEGKTGVFLRFKNQVISNNSYISYYRIKNTPPDRLYCHTDNTDCCTDINDNSNWFLPNGSRILGGFEYENVWDGVFARSRGLGMVGLYRLYSPRQSGKFKCVIPDSSGNDRTLYVNIVHEIPTLTMQPELQPDG